MSNGMKAVLLIIGYIIVGALIISIPAAAIKYLFWG